MPGPLKPNPLPSSGNQANTDLSCRLVGVKLRLTISTVSWGCDSCQHHATQPYMATKPYTTHFSWTNAFFPGFHFHLQFFPVAHKWKYAHNSENMNLTQEQHDSDLFNSNSNTIFTVLQNLEQSAPLSKFCSPRNTGLQNASLTRVVPVLSRLEEELNYVWQTLLLYFFILLLPLPFSPPCFPCAPGWSLAGLQLSAPPFGGSSYSLIQPAELFTPCQIAVILVGLVWVESLGWIENNSANQEFFRFSHLWNQGLPESRAGCSSLPAHHSPLLPPSGSIFFFYHPLVQIDAPPPN